MTQRLTPFDLGSQFADLERRVEALERHAPPEVLLGRARTTTPSATFTTTATAIGLSASVNVGIGRVVWINGRCRVNSSVAGDTFTVYILRDGVIIDAGTFTQPSLSVPPLSIWTIDEGPSPGSHTYSISAIRSSGTGNINDAAGPTTPSILLLSDIGPV